MRFFSYRNRPVHLGPFPLETLRRSGHPVGDASVMPMEVLPTEYPELSIGPAIRRYLAMMDAVRDGDVVHEQAEIPRDPRARADHLKAAAYYFDASMVGIAALRPGHCLPVPRSNSEIGGIREELARGAPPGLVWIRDEHYDRILASMERIRGDVGHHHSAIVFLVHYARDPRPDEPGAEWIHGVQAERAAILNANVAILIASYIRLLGHEARAHTLTATEVDLNRLGVAAGLCIPDRATGDLANPFVGHRFGLAAVTTTLELAPDLPLDPGGADLAGWFRRLEWATGWGGVRTASGFDPYASRDYRMGPYPFEKIRRVERPTTLIDEARVPRPPKRANWFERALYGDLGSRPRDASIGVNYIEKSPIGACARDALNNLAPLQFGDARGGVSPTASDPARNADNIKAACYFLAADAVGLSRAPDWVYYSHDSAGEEIEPYHDNAVSMLFDQGHETMEGASGDDWISVAQSMRAYLRFSLLGGVIGEQIRRLGYSARVHTSVEGDVLQPPLLLLAGLGEVSRIGDVILNPYLGPRLKSGAITTSMPMVHDRPIDFGLQNFCAQCNKCARECPSGAITAGPKVMFNGYEIWRSDPEKCTRYRITNAAGGMCGRCMKTCPWNLEGLFSDSAFRWLAMHAPSSAGMLARLDDALDRGVINPVKTWWWDIELNEDRTRYVEAAETNRRELQKNLEMSPEEESLAAYTSDLRPLPLPVAQPVDRDAAIARYRSLLSPAEYRSRLARGDTGTLVPGPAPRSDSPPVFPVVVWRRDDLAPDIVRFELARPDGSDLPPFEAGAHIDVMIAPEFPRQFSLAGDPADASRYVLGIQRESDGRGGSLQAWRSFKEGRRVHISPPRNHFPLDESATLSILMAGGIGVTPLIAMAHRLHALRRPFLFHYSARTEEGSGFASVLRAMPWAENVLFHFSREGGRADFNDLIPKHRRGYRLYTCGSDRYMNDVFSAAAAKGWPDEALAREYFSLPEQPARENHPFLIELTRSGRTVEVGIDQIASEALEAAGVRIDTKCSDGLCGTCVVSYARGDVEHRDFVLSGSQRQHRMALCCSRAREPGGVIAVDL